MSITDPDRQLLLQRPIEEDTHVLSSRFIRLDGIPILLERWRWEGIHGSTAVLLDDRIGGMDDTALERFLTEQAGLDLGSVTIVQDEAFVFFNFGFES